MCNTYNKLVIDKLLLNSQETLLLKSLESYYTKNVNNFTLLDDIINGTSSISRRTIEYFVTNYASENNISFDLKSETQSNTINFNVYISYKDQLKAHKKRYFDPFGRGIRIPFFINDICIITTIGQLNFYRWFFSKNIHNYCLTNYNTIQSSLINKKKNSKTKKNKNNINITPIDYVESKRLACKDTFTISFNI